MGDNALNIAELKANNKRRILESLKYAPLSRAELSREIGLTKSSITLLVNELISEGILVEAGQAPKSFKAGRIGTLLEINGDYGFIIGINLHRKNISVAAVNLKGEAIFNFNKKVTDFISTEKAFACIVENINFYIEKNKLDKEKLLQIGVASPGPLDVESGKILEPPNFAIFNNFSIMEELNKIYNCPVLLENNAVALALYESRCLKRHFGRSLFVVVSDGIGGALLHNDEIYRGSHGVAGELGHISINFNGEQCACGNRGCLEQYATLSALKNRFGFDDYKSVVDSAINGGVKENEIIDFLVSALGTALVATVNLMDLDRIIIYGEYSYKSEFLFKKIEEYLEQHSLISKYHKISVKAAVQDVSATACAAAIPALNSILKYDII